MKIAYLNPWGEHGDIILKINGHTGLLATIGGGTYIPYNDIKDMTSYEVLDTYDYLIIPFWGGFYEILKKIKSTSSVKIIGVGDVELNAIPYAPRQELKKLVECARLCNIFLTSNPDTLPIFSTIRQGHTYDISGWCIFPEYHRQYITHPEKKDRNQISIGCSNSGYNRNVLENLLAFQLLLKDFPDLIGNYWCVHPDHDNELRDLVETIGIPMKNINFRRELPYQSFLAEFAKMYLSIHLYTFKVVSRMAQDAMALGIPHIGCNANFADRVFCNMSVPDYDVVAAYQSAKRLLTDTNLYMVTALDQLDGVGTYSSQTIGTKIIEAIAAYEKA